MAEPVMDDYWVEYGPYSMIGVATTLPRDENYKANSRPIGFIWSKQSNSGTSGDARNPRPNGGRGSSYRRSKWRKKNK